MYQHSQVAIPVKLSQQSPEVMVKPCNAACYTEHSKKFLPKLGDTASDCTQKCRLSRAFLLRHLARLPPRCLSGTHLLIDQKCHHLSSGKSQNLK